jgi:hypothetical protein
MNTTHASSIAKVLAALILVVFTFLIFAQGEKKFTLDELDFPAVAKATSETGVPIYYRGEATAHHLGLYHPPLYIYALAAQIKVFGFSENTVRAFGLACALFTAYLALALSRNWLPERSQDIYTFAFLGIYLLNPYTAANTTLPDIDSTILPPLMTLFVLFLIKNKSNLALASVFCLLLWAKLTTPLALVPFALACWKFSGEPMGRLLRRTILVFGGGALLFLATYWIYCTSLNLPFGYTFSFLVHSFTKGSASPGMASFVAKIWSNLGNTKYLASEIGTPLVFLFLASLIFFGIKSTQSPERRNAFFILCLCAAVTLFYCSLIGPFGGFFKYPFAVFQFACIGASLLVVQSLEKFEGKSFLWFISLALIAFAFALVQMLHWHDRPSFGTHLSAGVAFAIAIVVGIVAGLALTQRNGIARGATGLVLIVFTAALGTGFGIARYEAIAPFPTKYSYGQMGMNETVAYLKANLKSDEIVWSMKDIGFYSGNHYIENYDFFFTPGQNEKMEAMVKSGVRFFVATQGIGEDRIDVYPAAREALENCCRLEKNFGNFYIYVPK